jgi:hypothetical protein
VITTACSITCCNGACRGFNNNKKPTSVLMTRILVNFVELQEFPE